MTTPTEALVALSRWIDEGNKHRDPEAITWGRLAKITEEAGEVIEAYIGATGQNPRKGVTAHVTDVVDELLDVAVTALGAVEHMTGHEGMALVKLNAKILRVATRAGLVPHHAKCYQSVGVPEGLPSTSCDCGTLWMLDDYAAKETP